MKNLKRKIIDRIAAFFRFPGSSVEMFGLAGELSGLNKDNMPSELLPLNAVQLSRGLLNYTFLQSNMNWVFPFWAAEQYNPSSKSFIPRAHLGLSMNITNRNWTGIGNIDFSVEPIVDPRGMVTPFRDGWSIDTWMISNGKILLPSSAAEVVQKPLSDLPIVENEISAEVSLLRTTAFTISNELFIYAETGGADESIVFSVRPFNPEGVSPVYSISYEADENSLTINKKDRIYFESQPDLVVCSSLEEGDAFMRLDSKKSKYHSECRFGLASAVVKFSCGDKNISQKLKCPLDQGKISQNFPNPVEAVRRWEDLLNDGILIETPDKKINSLFKFSAATLMMLIDSDKITPGPFTYHQFWIRDAAYMLYALAKTGHADHAEKVVRKFASYKDKKGFFRSQKGEWDSNGQVLWAVYQHAVYSGSNLLLEEIFEQLFAGVRWINNSRLKDEKYEGKPFYGLLPPGLSAEHLGHVDYYFWDNFWSIAGLEAFAEICRTLHKDEELKTVESIIKEYKDDIEEAIMNVGSKFSLKSIPASCTRGEDCGMIGSVAAAYPLQYFGKDDGRVKATLDELYSKYFYDGMMFQDFIHSGMNAYLSLQTAHAYLYLGDRDKFNEILNAVISKASATFTFPEAINPATGGGAMGDGHHGWAAAEIVSAIRDAFVFERYKNSAGFEELVLLQGIPPEWFEGGYSFFLKNAPVYNGTLAMIINPGADSVIIKIEFKSNDENIKVPLRVSLPFLIEEVNIEGNEIKSLNKKAKSFTLNACSCTVTIIKKRIEEANETLSEKIVNN